MKKESEAVVLKKVMLEASRLGLVVFRNQSGMYKLLDGRYIRSGLIKGASDLIGWQKSTGRFVAIEVKAVGGRPSAEQKNFIDAVNNAGGIGFFAYSEKDVSEGLKKCKALPTQAD